MYAVAVLDRNALSAFRREYPWLDLPEDVHEVTIHFDDNGGPTRLAALSKAGDGSVHPANVDSFGLEMILALIRYAPQGSPAIEDCPEEAEVRAILETLPLSKGFNDVDRIERERAGRLEHAYQIVRGIAHAKLADLQNICRSERERERLKVSSSSLPPTLTAVEERHKPIFLQTDLWRLVAVLRDELSLPADYQLAPPKEEASSPRIEPDPVPASTMSDPVIQALFDLSPVAFSISSTGEKNSRYVRVNQAYLDLVGKTWEDIDGNEMISSGVVIGSQERSRRLMMLERDGGYTGETAEIRAASGETIRVHISARRLILAGQLYDFEVLTPADELLLPIGA